MDIDELIGLILTSQMTLGSRVLHEPEVHVGALLVVIGNEKDESRFVSCLRDVGVIGKGTCFKVTLDGAIVLKSLKDLNNLDFKLNCPSRHFFAVDCN